MYDNMSPFKRNNMLKEMLENNHVIVFPNEEDYADGIPQLKILDSNLKVLTGEGPVKQKKDVNDRCKRKPRVDMGLPV